MRASHRDKGPLHGITVVVDAGEELWIGRCDEVSEAGVHLKDADVFREPTGRQDYLAKAARFGHWPRVAQALVPSDQVVSIEKLDDLNLD